MTSQLATVVCLCYNQARFVRASVESVLNQTHEAVQLIIVDDASNDGSQQVIRQLQHENPGVELLLLDHNIGNCKAFNKALILAKGKYIIDLAADDILKPQRIQHGIKALESHGEDYSVHFSDAEYIDEEGNYLSLHSEKYPHADVPQGSIYSELIRRYFICPPSLMVRTDLMERLGGYDENLYYEDFDFLIRASRLRKFCYSPDALVQKRIVKGSLSSQQTRLFSRHARSTYEICKKVYSLNQTRKEKEALSRRVAYEILVNVKLLNVGLVVRYAGLWLRNKLGDVKR